MTNNYLSANEIRKVNISEIFTNKKISLKKFKNLNKKNYFYYKNIKSFLNPEKKYFDLFSQNEIVLFKDGKYSYKKKIIKKKKKKFIIFKKNKINIKNFEIENSTLNYGLKYGKLVKSDRFIKFQNFVLKKKINKHKIRITNFPFPILDIKLNSDTKKFNLKIIIHKKFIT